MVTLIKNVIKPFFHLWYVPSLLFSMVLTRFLFKKVHSSGKRLWYVMLVSFLFYGISNGLDFEVLPSYFAPLDAFQSIYRLQYWVFFVWGVFLKQNADMLVPKKGMRWIYPIYFLMVVLNFYWSHWSYEWLLFQVANDIYQYKGQGFKALNWLGVESLGFYLWHYVSTMLIKFWVGIEDLFAYYIWNFLGLIFTFLILYLFTKNNRTHQIFMGILRKS
jgi:hypothetical protein